MKKTLITLIALLMSGCTITRTPSINTTKEIPIDLGNTSNKVCSVSILGFIGPFGDNSVAKAARDAGITTVTYYEKTYHYFILWGESCNTVYGNNFATKQNHSGSYNRWMR